MHSLLNKEDRIKELNENLEKIKKDVDVNLKINVCVNDILYIA